MKPCTIKKRCVAKTLDGKRCKKCRVEGSDLCAIHLALALSSRSRSRSASKSRSRSASKSRSRSASKSLKTTLAAKLRQALAERERAMALQQLSLADEQSTSPGSYPTLFSSSSLKKLSSKKASSKKASSKKAKSSSKSHSHKGPIKASELQSFIARGALRHVTPKTKRSPDSLRKAILKKKVKSSTNAKTETY